MLKDLIKNNNKHGDKGNAVSQSRIKTRRIQEIKSGTETAGITRYNRRNQEGE